MTPRAVIAVCLFKSITNDDSIHPRLEQGRQHPTSHTGPCKDSSRSRYECVI